MSKEKKILRRQCKILNNSVEFLRFTAGLISLGISHCYRWHCDLPCLTLTFLLNLIIFVSFFAEARADISGPPEKYLKLGSPLRLGCKLMQSTEPPIFVFWYHNNRMINYDNDRGVNVSTDLAAKTSSLLIASASPEHTGNYSCVPNNAQPASTFVHILNGKSKTDNSDYSIAR